MTAEKYLGRFAAGFKKTPVIAIMRGVTPETVAAAVDAIQKGGIRFIEVTLDSPDALKSIEILCGLYEKNGDIFIGAGTVLKAEAAAAAAKAGAGYIISPNTNPTVIRETKRLDLVSIPGFYTPSEAFTAVEAGADYLKCFPVLSLGINGVKSVKAVISKPIIAVGGIDADNLADYLKVSAGVGIGSNLYSPNKKPEELYRLASEIMTKVRQVSEKN